ncbi:MAG TPA: MmgE/PrpD family protein [Xanthobacteraceae bacterium]|nr:MmgE/PrpD family protein [Xanthobacteraceae bacterium]
MTTLEQLGSFVAHCAAPSRRLREILDLHVADTVGSWIASLPTPEAAALLRWRTASGEGAAPGSMHALRLDIAAHCALARMSEIDDIHLASTTTPGAIVVPAAVTIAAACRNRDPDALAAAMMAGYEVTTRFAQAIDGATILSRGIWPTYFAAPLGVAAVAARLLDLDAKQCAHALALALVRSAPGVGHHNAATTSRWLAVGQAAETGVTAALAARAGFTSDLGLLDGGYLPGIFGLKPNPAVLTHGLGEHFRLGEVAFKPWCAAGQTMAATQALTEIVRSGVGAETIIQVTAFVLPPHRRMIDHGVTVGDRASFLTSLPYRLALAALAPHEAFNVGQTPAAVPEDIRAFMDRIAIVPDEALLSNFPSQWPARVEVTASSGRYERTVTDVPGDHAIPFDAGAVQEKFHRFVAPVIGPDSSAHLLEHALGLLSGKADSAGLLHRISEIRYVRHLNEPM